MIFYFTGTGNSLYAAKTIADTQNDKLLSIPQEVDKEGNTFTYELKDDELLGFVFPVYAWAPPKMVLDFISKMSITGGNPFVFSLNTCGSEECKTTSVIEKALKAKGITLNCAFSIVMPSNYIIGADIYPKDKEEKILLDADQKLAGINKIIAERQDGVFQLLPGKMPALKTAIVSSLFNRFATNTKYFLCNRFLQQMRNLRKELPGSHHKSDRKTGLGQGVHAMPSLH